MQNSEFEKIFRSEFPEIELTYDALTNTYANNEAQIGWRMWQIHEQKTEEMLDAKQDYVCDCGFLDHVDDDQIDLEEISVRVQLSLNDKTKVIIDRANTFGLDELFDEIDELGQKIGKNLNRQKLCL